MSHEGQYALDSNVFIEAKRRYYAFGLCPGFWDSLLWHEAAGRVRSIDRVRDEIQSGNDDLTKWALTVAPASLFSSTADATVLALYAQVASWVQAHQQFNPEAKTEFASGADGWLIAYAKANNRIVVTHEVLALDARRRVPLPNVCQAFGVAFVDTFTMLTDLNVQFTWTRPAGA